MNQTSTSQDRNRMALAQGMGYRIEVFTRSLVRNEPEFAASKAEARRRRQDLQAVGYMTSLFAITPTGSLVPLN